MKITENFDVTKRGNGFEVVINGITNPNTNEDFMAEIENIYNSLRRESVGIRETRLNEFLSNGIVPILKEELNKVVANAEKEITHLTFEQRKTNAIQGLMDFFTDFLFEPSYRFLNTLAHSTTQKDAKEYIVNYFRLIDSPYANEVVSKVKSKEFATILKELVNDNPTKNINDRFKIYYGSAGTGKTTLAMSQTDNRCVVCNASMLPSDLMEDFIFESGNPTFKPSTLWNCMENGTPIVLDEINLLPFDSLRFLQGILDGKTEFDYKGKKVHINNGFQIIGTMNLSIGGMTYGLPEPLVDRTCEMREFKLTAENLLNALM